MSCCMRVGYQKEKLRQGRGRIRHTKLSQLLNNIDSPLSSTACTLQYTAGNYFHNGVKRAQNIATPRHASFINKR